MAFERKSFDTGYRPDFVLQREVDEEKLQRAEAEKLAWEETHLGVVTVECWSLFAEMALSEVPDLRLIGDKEQDAINIDVAKMDYGPLNVYTGDLYDEASGAPVAHERRGSIYVTPAGQEYYRHILPQIVTDRDD